MMCNITIKLILLYDPHLPFWKKVKIKCYQYECSQDREKKIISVVKFFTGNQSPFTCDNVGAKDLRKNND